jgi:hypothetical protein
MTLDRGETTSFELMRLENMDGIHHPYTSIFLTLIPAF